MKRSTTNKTRIDMKYINNIITKDSFVIKRRLVGMFLAVATLFLVACEDDSTTVEVADNKPAIAGTLSYATIIIPSGSNETTVTKLPTWENAPAGQEIVYSIARVDGNPLNGVSIDSSTGEITVAVGSIRSFLGLHIITATGTGTTYKGTIEASVSIEEVDNRVAIAGTLSYTDIIIPPPSSGGTTAVETKLPTWENAPAGQEIAYSIARVDGNPLNGVSIDSSTGEIALATGATKLLASYTITATGTGTAYKGTMETNMDIWVQAAFIYNQAEITAINNLDSIPTDPPVEVNVSSSTFELYKPSEGLGVASDTGVVTVTPLIPNSNTYINGGTHVIKVTEGEETYGVKIDITFPKPTTRTDLVTLVQDTMTAHGNEANLNFIDISSMTDISGIFYNTNTSSFNGDISRWDTSAVTSMESMFRGTIAFNGDISGWDVSKVTTTQHMFTGAKAFNGDVSGWDVGAVINISRMFKETSVFNQDLSKWDVSSVKDMQRMFESASAFNNKGVDLSWDVSSVKDMQRMFAGATAFNQGLTSKDGSSWDVRSIENMTYMFAGATIFNQNISEWAVSAVTDMAYMFNGATAFNQDLDKWGVESTVIITGMFGNSGLVGNEPNWYRP